MTLAGFPRISVGPAICGGRPIITGTRVCVTDVLEMLAGGATAGEIAQDFPYLVEADVRAVLAYAAAQADHPVVLAGERNSWMTKTFMDLQHARGSDYSSPQLLE